MWNASVTQSFTLCKQLDLWILTTKLRRAPFLKQLSDFRQTNILSLTHKETNLNE